MAKRRGNQEGAIYQRANGSWQAQVSIEGRRLSNSFPSRNECRLWIKEITEQKEKGLSILSANLTLGDFLDQWLSSVRHKLRPMTWMQYKGIAEHHLKPQLGKTKLLELKPVIVQSLYAKKLDKGVGVRTVQMMHAVLHRSLKIAEKQGLIANNPIEAVEKPTYSKTEMKVLSDDEVRSLLSFARGGPLELIIQLAVTTGMRKGELLGLRWGDVDWASSTIRVQRQLQRMPGRGLVNSQPKTNQGIRTVQIGSETLRKLMAQKSLQEKVFGNGKGNEQNVFLSSAGTAKEPRNLVREFKALLKKSDLPDVRFHDLRHTAASLMLMSGMPVMRIARQLGHAKPSTTLDIYGHLIPGLEVEAAERIDQIVTSIAAELQQVDQINRVIK
jgi:integrase